MQRDCLFNSQDLSLALKKFIISQNLLHDLKIHNIVTDSRLVVKGSLFIAYKGNSKDARDFIPGAVEKNVSCVICETIGAEVKEMLNEKGISLIVVTDAIAAFHALASYRRSQLSKAKFIAITGSMGKTSVKNMMAEILSACNFKVICSQKSYNNFVGMPITLVNAPYDTEVVILEMGTNHLGEIDVLTKIARPNISIITCIGSAHIGNFENGIEDIIKAKAEIMNGMTSDDLLILNEDNEYFKHLIQYAKAKGLTKILRVGKKPSSHIYIDNYNVTPYNSLAYEVNINGASMVQKLSLNFNGLGVHNIFNTLFPIIIAHLFKVPLERIANLISDLSISDRRGNIEYFTIEGKKVMVINDTYNCSYEAMLGALAIMGSIKKSDPDKRIVCFLGNMGELGKYSESFHQKLLKPIHDNMVDIVHTVGTEAYHLYKILPEKIKGQHFENSAAMAKSVKDLFENNDAALFKGARSLEMEKVIEKLYQK